MPALGVGEQAAVVASLPAVQTLTRESNDAYQFIVRADSGETVAESIEDNNQATSQHFFIVTPFIPDPVVEQDHDEVGSSRSFVLQVPATILTGW